MKDNHPLADKTVIILGREQYSVGAAVIPLPDGTGMIPGIVIARVAKKGALLFDLAGKKIESTPDIVAVIGLNNRQSAQILMKACLTTLGIFDEAEAELAKAKTPEQQKPL